MANYGPPVGGPPEPWRERRPEQSYGQPSGPWGQDGWDDRTGYGLPAQPGRPPEQPYPSAQPGHPPGRWREQSYPVVGLPGPPPGPRRSRGALVAVLVLLAVLLIGGGATAYYLLGQDDRSEVTAAGSGRTTPTPTAPATESAPPSPSAAPQSSADPRFVKAGQCVRNEAPAGDKPKLMIAGCAPNTYEVLRRIDGATSGEKDAEAKCASVEGYTNWFFFNSELDTLDYVLCLKLR